MDTIEKNDVDEEGYVQESKKRRVDGQEEIQETCDPSNGGSYDYSGELLRRLAGDSMQSLDQENLTKSDDAEDDESEKSDNDDNESQNIESIPKRQPKVKTIGRPTSENTGRGSRGAYGGRRGRGRARGGRGGRGRGGRKLSLEDTDGPPREKPIRASSLSELGENESDDSQPHPKGKIKEKGIRGRKPSPATLVAAQWVACDACGKWRRLPKNITSDQLPEIWTCEMSSWDTQRNTCQSPEEAFPHLEDFSKGRLSTEDRDHKANEAALEVSDDIYGTERLMASTGGRWPRKTSVSETTVHENDSDKEGGALVRRIGVASNFARRPQSVEVALETGTATSGHGQHKAQSSLSGSSSGMLESVNWVQCNDCQKWRKVPLNIDVNSLPEVWLCRMNSWDAGHSRCSAPEESEEKAAAPTETKNAAVESSIDVPCAPPPQPQVGVGRGRYARRKPGLSNGMEAQVGGGVVKKVTQWVQCERPSCKKWRKIPATVDMSTFPEKWYCEMNRWDQDRATCEDPEDSESDEEDPRGPSIFGSSKGPGSLSYRRIIFGTDGKVRPVYNEKNKSGFGVFSYTETHRNAAMGGNVITSTNPGESEEYNEPIRRVGYWFSSNYDESGSNYVSSSRQGAITLGARRDYESATDVVGSKIGLDTSDKRSRAMPPTAGRLESETAVSSSSSLAFDCIRRYVGWKATPSAVTRHKISISEIPLFKRLALECQVVTTCLSQIALCQPQNSVVEEGNERADLTSRSESDSDSDSDEYNHSQSNFMGLECVAIAALLDFIKKTWFQDPGLEACRGHLTLISLRSALHRLEQSGHVDVTFSATGDVCIQLFSLSIRAQQRIEESRRAQQRSEQVGSKIRKPKYPIQLRP